MEFLNKQQIILLALLVSFVSSIASGIVTVSIMTQNEQAPITQTINRVVERTIERVSDPALSSGSTKETIIVKDDVAVVNAISTASKGIVRIFLSKSGLDDQSNNQFVGIGVIADSKGKIIASLNSSSYGDGELSGYLDGGNKVKLAFDSYDSKTNISVLSAEQSSDEYNIRAYTPVKFADPDALRLGQTAVLVGGNEKPRIATGIVSFLDKNQIETSVTDSSFDTDAILVNLLGEVMGMNNSNASSHTFFTSRIIQTYATP